MEGERGGLQYEMKATTANAGSIDRSGPYFSYLHAKQGEGQSSFRVFAAVILISIVSCILYPNSSFFFQLIVPSRRPPSTLRQSSFL
mmetsp:Transcript_43371/g.112828  ORF Transcript_43371/g.112828 Transcript_43371/m.112828 type:complete len:87 (+) Transcript_43371:251-511(+)